MDKEEQLEIAEETIYYDLEEWEILESDLDELQEIIFDETDIKINKDIIKKIKNEYIEEQLENFPDQNDLVKALFEEGVIFTDDITQAIWVFPKGTMISGEFEYGSRGQDHRIIETSVFKHNRNDGIKFWNEVHEKYNVIRLTPETNQALIKENQPITRNQRDLVELGGFELVDYIEDKEV